MKRCINSFKCAFDGIRRAVSEESHLRFHITAGAYVVVFAFFYDFSPERWAVILLLIAAVISAELFNTALEDLCDLNTDGYDPLAKAAKDAAAGAVLVLSVSAAFIGVLFFYDPVVIKKIFLFFSCRPPLTVLLAFSAAVSAVFVGLGPKGVYKIFLKIKNRCKR